MGNYNYFWPDDIIREILLRLPVQSLLRFKTVSKLWFDVITSSNFIDSHYQHPSKPKLFVMLTQRRELYSISVLPGGINRVDDRSMPFALEAGKYAAEIVGSSNGLVCLSIRSKISNDLNAHILWNPATRQYRELPPNRICYSQAQGFGFHHGINDYKLLQVAYRKNGQQEAKVLALSTGSWRKVEDTLPSYDYGIAKPVVVKGVWYHTATAARETPFIIRFDMGDDTISKVKTAPIPYHSSPEYLVKKVKLMEYKELPAICVFEFEYNYWIPNPSLSFKIDIWLMNNEQSWTKVLTCSQNSVPISDVGLLPLGFWVDEESIISENYERDGLSLFNLSTKQSKVVVLDEAKRFGSAHSYVESMVSVYPTRSQDRDSTN